MKNRFSVLLLTLIVTLSVCARAQKDDDDDDDKMQPRHAPVMKPTEQPAGAQFSCPYETDFRAPHKFGKFTLRLLPTKKDKDDKDDKDKDQDGDARCRAVLSRSWRRSIPIAYEWALSVDPISGSALTGDRTPTLVLSGYSGGLHCCYVYEMVSLGPKPQVLHTFSNLAPIKFEKQPDGTVLIRAVDGVFDYFLIPHNAAVIPQLVLKIEGDKLVDVSAQYSDLYDKEIEQTRSQLGADELEKFRKSNFHDKLYTDQVAAVHKVLTIVLDYIYSGRQEQAWQALNDMWPAGDVSRVKSLITERRRRGMLSNLACDCRPVAVKQMRPTKRKPTGPDEIDDPRVKAIIDD